MVEIVTHIKQNPNSTKRVLGLSNEKLNMLIDKAKESEKRRKEEIAKTEIRLIKPGGGRKSILNKATLLFGEAIPGDVYCRNPTQVSWVCWALPRGSPKGFVTSTQPTKNKLYSQSPPLIRGI